RGSTARREVLDLRDVALDLFEEESLRLIAPEAEMRLKIGESPILVEADLLSLQEAAKNLVGNALSHGQPPVTIGAGATDGEAMLWIEDAGPGPAPEVRSHMGERFNMGTAATGSSGLGMSIAAAVAEAYGGRLAMETRAEGFRISIILPLREVT
ncbi:MAG: HAMP domain-containing sensor histidine kinase, partial [Maritimibacter sp.]